MWRSRFPVTFDSTFRIASIIFKAIWIDHFDASFLCFRQIGRFFDVTWCFFYFSVVWHTSLVLAHRWEDRMISWFSSWLTVFNFTSGLAWALTSLKVLLEWLLIGCSDFSGAEVQLELDLVVFELEFDFWWVLGLVCEAHDLQIIWNFEGFLNLWFKEVLITSKATHLILIHTTFRIRHGERRLLGLLFPYSTSALRSPCCSLPPPLWLGSPDFIVNTERISQRYALLHPPVMLSVRQEGRSAHLDVEGLYLVASGHHRALKVANVDISLLFRHSHKLSRSSKPTYYFVYLIELIIKSLTELHRSTRTRFLYIG